VNALIEESAHARALGDYQTVSNSVCVHVCVCVCRVCVHVCVYVCVCVVCVCACVCVVCRVCVCVCAECSLPCSQSMARIYQEWGLIACVITRIHNIESKLLSPKALDKAKDAGRKERVLCKQREQAQATEQINLDLTYCVSAHSAQKAHSHATYLQSELGRTWYIKFIT